MRFFSRHLSSHSLFSQHRLLCSFVKATSRAVAKPKSDNAVACPPLLRANFNTTTNYRSQHKALPAYPRRPTTLFSRLFSEPFVFSPQLFVLDLSLPDTTPSRTAQSRQSCLSPTAVEGRLRFPRRLDFTETLAPLPCALFAAHYRARHPASTSCAPSRTTHNTRTAPAAPLCRLPARNPTQQRRPMRRQHLYPPHHQHLPLTAITTLLLQHH